MIKKILLLAICSILLFTCGKKSDPKYSQSNKELTINHFI